MRRGVATGLAVGMVVINAGAFWYLRETLSTPPPEPDSSGAGSDVPSATPDDAPPFAGPVLLTGAADGSVLRSTHGDCDGAAVPAAAWVAAPGEAPVEVEVPGLVETLALGADGGGWFVVGADDACEVKAWSGNADGSSWSEAEIPTGVWYLDPSDDTQVISPRRPRGGAGRLHAHVGPVQRPLRLPALRERQRERGPTAPTRQFVAYAASEGLGGLAPREDGRVATLGESTSPACGALLRVFDDEKIVDETCLSNDKAGLGVTWAGDTLVAQIGYDLMDQDDDGDWVVRG